MIVVEANKSGTIIMICTKVLKMRKRGLANFRQNYCLMIAIQFIFIACILYLQNLELCSPNCIAQSLCVLVFAKRLIKTTKNEQNAHSLNKYQYVWNALHKMHHDIMKAVMHVCVFICLYRTWHFNWVAFYCKKENGEFAFRTYVHCEQTTIPKMVRFFEILTLTFYLFRSLNLFR